MPTTTPAMPAPYRGRFAPSPTGDLHPGSLLAALGSWLFARRAGGAWLVRIEDLDPPREVEGAARRQLDTLRAFGLLPDGEVAWQSQRGALYQAALDTLVARGDAFTCHCSRADLAGTGGVHRHCAPGAERTDPAIRFRVPDGTVVAFDDAIHGRVVQDVGADVGDFVLRRTDGLWAYQLAVVVDDAAQGITEVVRGADLLDSTARQLLLQRALGLPTPGYVHLPLLVDAQGRKLSKSLAALPVDPADPMPSLRMAWAQLGQAPGVLDRARTPADALARALDAFSPDAIPRAVLPLPGTHDDPVTGQA